MMEGIVLLRSKFDGLVGMSKIIAWRLLVTRLSRLLVADCGWLCQTATNFCIRVIVDFRIVWTITLASSA
jgi:hypothetical protein